MQSIRQNMELQRVMNAVAAGTTTQNGSGVKLDDAEGVCFNALFGAITAGAVTSVKLQQSDDDGSSDAYDDIEGSSVVVADTSSNKLVPVEVYRPTKLWVRPVIVRGTQNAVIDGITAIKFGLRRRPHTAHSTTLTGKTLVGPAEGTA